LTVLKSIVAALVLANVGYFLWTSGIAAAPGVGGGGHPAPGAVTAHVSRPGGPASGSAVATPSLKLASEAPGVATPGAATPGAATPDAAVVGGAAGAGGSGTAGDAAGGVATPSVGTPAEAAAPAAGVSGVIAPGAVAPGAVAPGIAALGAASPLQSSAAAGGARCRSLGPFREVSEAARVAGALRSSGYDPRQRVADGEIWAGVWVYLPLPAAPVTAAQILDKLKAGGIDDALEMPGPNDASVISLGLFSEQKRAQARVAQAQALALNPAVADRKRNGNVYWIDIDLKPNDVLNPADLQGDSSHIMRLEVKDCPAASGSQP